MCPQVQVELLLRNSNEHFLKLSKLLAQVLEQSCVLGSCSLRSQDSQILMSHLEASRQDMWVY
jgi:hypothetical protein